MKNIKFYIKLIIISFLIAFLPIPIRAVSIVVSSIVSAFLFMIFTYFVLKKKSEKYSSIKLLSCIVGGLCLVVFVHVLPDIIRGRALGYTWHPLSIYSLLFFFLGVIIGYILFKSKFIYKIITILLLLLFSYAYYSVLSVMIMNKRVSGTYSGILEEKVKYDFDLQDSLGNTIPFSSFKNKIVVIDFWSTHCGICYKIMPHFSELYEKYKDNDAIEFYMVHCYGENESFTTGRKILHREGFNVPSLSTKISGETLNLLTIDGFPECVIFNSNGEMIFRGSMPLMERAIKKELERISK